MISKTGWESGCSDFRCQAVPVIVNIDEYNPTLCSYM